jgi:MFS family permease
MTLAARLAQSARAFGRSFGNPGLRRLQLAFAGSEIGGWGYSIALWVLAFEAGGAAALGVLALVTMLAPGIAAPFTSILGDRYDRVRVMVGSDLVRIVLMAAAAGVAFAGAPTGILYALAALASVAATAFRPAQAAILPSLARTPDELTAANVASSTIESATAFVGPALGGVVVAATEPGVSFAIAAGTFLWSAVLVAGIPRPAPAGGDGADQTDPAQDESEGILRAVAAGARTVATESRARLIVTLVSAQTLVAGALLVFVPVLALDLLDWGEEGLGTINAALGIGGVVGAVMAVSLVGSRRLSRPLAIGTVLWGAPIALAAAWDTRAGALVLFGAVGLANTIVDVAAYTMLQRAVPDHVLARVFGVLESLGYATHAVGGVVAAVLVEAFGLQVALVGVGLALPALVLLTWPRLARLDAAAAVPERALELLRGVPFLALLPQPALEALALRAVWVTVPAGEPVFRQGDRGDRFYVIAAGEAGVTIDGEERPPLSAGGWFGEIALLRDVPRTATITARTGLDLLALERDDFIAAVTGHPPSSEAAGAVVGARLAARPALGPV